MNENSRPIFFVSDDSRTVQTFQEPDYLPEPPTLTRRSRQHPTGVDAKRRGVRQLTRCLQRKHRGFDSLCPPRLPSAARCEKSAENHRSSKIKPVSKRVPHNIVRGILLLTDPLQSPPVSDHPRQSGLQAGVLLTGNHLLQSVAFCPPRLPSAARCEKSAGLFRFSLTSAPTAVGCSLRKVRWTVSLFAHDPQK